MTEALIEALRAALPIGWTLTPVPTEEQQRGDLLLEGAGRRTYIELKTEDFPDSLFLEPIQYWMDAAGVVYYRRSWAYTTTAQVMLQLSGRTGQALFSPRAPWLSAGLRLLQAQLLSTRAADVPFRNYLAVNSSRVDGVDVLTGGAAGGAVATSSWLEAFKFLGHDVSQVLMVDGAQVLTRAKKRALALDEAAILGLLKSLKLRSGQHVVSGVKETLCAWASDHSEAIQESDGSRQAKLRQDYNRIKTLPETAALGGIEAALAWLIRDEVSAYSSEPLTDDMWFLAATCLQCGWTFSKGEKLLQTANVVEAVLDQ